MTRFFITRPIFASVLSIIIVLSGLIAALQLPIAQYPQIAPPTVLITATFPGASADTLTKTVAAPIEEQLSGVENLLYFSSSSDSSGTLTITATFEVGTDVDEATFNISNRANIALPRLPEEVRRQGEIPQHGGLAGIGPLGASRDSAHCPPGYCSSSSSVLASVRSAVSKPSLNQP